MYLDILLVIIVILGLIDGVRKGFIYQFFSAFSIFLDYVIARNFTPLIMDTLGISTSDASYLMSFIAVFVISYIVLGFVKLALSLILKKENNTLLSKLGGGVLGLAKSLIIVVMILMGYNFLEQHIKSLSNFGKNSQINMMFLEKSESFEEYLPREAKNKITQIREKRVVEKFLNKVW